MLGIPNRTNVVCLVDELEDVESLRMVIVQPKDTDIEGKG